MKKALIRKEVYLGKDKDAVANACVVDYFIFGILVYRKMATRECVAWIGLKLL